MVYTPFNISLVCMQCFVDKYLFSLGECISGKEGKKLGWRIRPYGSSRHVKVIVRAGGISEVCRQWLLQVCLFFFVIYFLPIGGWYFCFCLIFSESLICSYDFIFHIIVSYELMKRTCANAISENHKWELFGYISRNHVIFQDVFSLT